VAGAIWVRNVLLNELILAPAMAAVITAAMLIVLLRQVSNDYARGHGLNPGLAIVGAIRFVAAIVVMALTSSPLRAGRFHRPPLRLRTLKAGRRGSSASSQSACFCRPSPSLRSILRR
jgi:hypothetical protein